MHTVVLLKGYGPRILALGLVFREVTCVKRLQLDTLVFFAVSQASFRVLDFKFVCEQLAGCCCIAP